MQIMQDCCIGTHIAMWFAASIPLSPTSGIYPHVIPPLPPHPPPLAPCNRPQCVMLPSLCPCVLIVHHPPISENMWCLIFCSCISLLRMMVSIFIHVPTKDTNSAIFMAAQFSMMYMCYIFLVQSIVDGHLGWFQLFTIINSATMNICMHVSL